MEMKIASPKILICEDNTEIREALALLLRMHSKVSIKQCVDGNEGIELLERESFDIVICDYDMGEGKASGTDVFWHVLRQGLKCRFYLFTSAFVDLTPYSAYPSFKWFSKTNMADLTKEISQQLYET